MTVQLHTGSKELAAFTKTPN